MSFYATIQGEVTYPDDESFDSVLSILKDGGWVDSEGFFIDESKDRIRENPGDSREYLPDIDIKNRVISIPCSNYRNMSRVEFFVKDGDSFKGQGTILGTSTDGCFCGWEIVDGIETTYDLNTWAKENLEGDNAVAPNREDFESEYDWAQNLCEWQANVENEFHSDI